MYITTTDAIKHESRNGLSNCVITCEIYGHEVQRGPINHGPINRPRDGTLIISKTCSHSEACVIVSFVAILHKYLETPPVESTPVK